MAIQSMRQLLPQGLTGSSVYASSSDFGESRGYKLGQTLGKALSRLFGGRRNDNDVVVNDEIMKDSGIDFDTGESIELNPEYLDTMATRSAKDISVEPPVTEEIAPNTFVNEAGQFAKHGEGSGGWQNQYVGTGTGEGDLRPGHPMLGPNINLTKKDFGVPETKMNQFKAVAQAVNNIPTSAYKFDRTIPTASLNYTANESIPNSYIGNDDLKTKFNQIGDVTVSMGDDLGEEPGIPQLFGPQDFESWLRTPPEDEDDMMGSALYESIFGQENNYTVYSPPEEGQQEQ